jgi:ribosomal protein S18 acetylase RimI-like enzyme
MVDAIDRAALREVADRHAAEALRHFAVHAAGAMVADRGAALLVASAVPVISAYHNAALPVDPKADPGAILAAARVFAAEQGRDIVVWASGHGFSDLGRAARAAGLPCVSSAAGMAIAAAPAQGAVPAGAALTRVSDAAGVAAFAQIHRGLCAEDGRPADMVAHFASAGALLAANVSAFIAWEGGRPVSCAMTVGTGDVAGVYWVATSAAARRKGFGELVTRAAVRAAFEHGADLVVLQATAAGEPVYKRIGFGAFTQYGRYLAACGPYRITGAEYLPLAACTPSPRRHLARLIPQRDETGTTRRSHR